VSVDANGLLVGISYLTAMITVMIRDVYGNIAQATTNVIVQDKIPLSCDITYQPATVTNQNVVATLIACIKTINVTNNG
jgi:hypothetical protein